MKYASVCSGVEAASLAWMPLGWEAAWFSEIEPFPCAVLKERFPNVPNLGDMTKIQVENMENGDQKFTGEDGTVVVIRGGVDLLVGGTPCQSFSVAGKREGLEGASGLAEHFVRLLREMRPRWFVWENVPGALSSRTNGQFDFNFLVREYAKCGYSCGWRVLDAQYVRVDGFPRAVPQRRRRVFVVGHSSSDWRYPASVLFEPDSLFGNTPPRRIKGKGVAADTERGVGTAGRLWDGSGVNPTLNQASAGSGTIGASNQELFSQNANGLVMTDVIRMRAGKPGGEKGALVSHETSPTLQAGANDQTVVSLASGQAGELGCIGEEVSQTLSRNNGGFSYVAGFDGNMGAKAGNIGYSEEESPTLRSGRGGAEIVCAGFNPSAGTESDVAYRDETVPTLRASVGGGRSSYSKGSFGSFAEHEIAGTITRHEGIEQDHLIVEERKDG